MIQTGVLRTNCIDCLDRTNVAQYAYGLAALGHQLHALGFMDEQKIDLDAPIAEDLMGFYERMGDTLAHQYGGSAAHNKVPLALHASSLTVLRTRRFNLFPYFLLGMTGSRSRSYNLIKYFHFWFCLYGILWILHNMDLVRNLGMSM